MAVTGILPDDEYKAADAMDFITSAVDAEVLEKVAAATTSGRVLRFIARVLSNGVVTVGLSALEMDHPLAALPAHPTVCAAVFSDVCGEGRPIVLQCPAPTAVTRGRMLSGEVFKLAAVIGRPRGPQ